MVEVMRPFVILGHHKKTQMNVAVDTAGAFLLVTDEFLRDAEIADAPWKSDKIRVISVTESRQFWIVRSAIGGQKIDINKMLVGGYYIHAGHATIDGIDTWVTDGIVRHESD